MWTIFFDIAETLASLRHSQRGELLSLEVYSHIPPLLRHLKARGSRLGIIANTSEGAERMRQLLEDAGIYEFFAPELLLYSADVGVTKSSPDIFVLAAYKARQSPENIIFVGEDAGERAVARTLGVRVAPHSRLLSSTLSDEQLHYARVSVPSELEQGYWRCTLAERFIVPLHITHEGGIRILAVASAHTLADLVGRGFHVERLGPPDAPLYTTAYLFREHQKASVFGPRAEPPTSTQGLLGQGGSTRYLGPRENDPIVLSATHEGLYVALPSEHAIHAMHFDGASHGHTQRLLPDLTLLSPARPTMRARAALRAEEVPPLTASDRAALAKLTSDSLQKHLDRYTGKAPVDAEGRFIASRHVRHPDNAVATTALVRDLATMAGGLLRVRRQRFRLADREYDNIEAELPGESGEEAVLVTAHLDSTGQGADGHTPERDPAPGADDDASGIAAVLAIAELFTQLAAEQTFKRSVRFVLFNAEEQGLVGSKAYAREVATSGESIAAVYQMDMIGHHKSSPPAARSFEVHVGFPASPGVEAGSLALAERLARLVEQVSPGLSPPQIYTSEHDDPAAGRSDHASFQERGYAACVASEDFFAGPLPNSPEAQPNPNYHTPGDVAVNIEYAADIARAVAAAALISARL